MKEPTVYVIQEQPRLNYADAQRFGELMFVCQYDFSPGENSRFNEIIRHSIQESLHHYNSEHDFLLLVGDPVLIGLAMSYALAKGPVNVLKWDKGGKRYTAIKNICPLAQV